MVRCRFYLKARLQVKLFVRNYLKYDYYSEFNTTRRFYSGYRGCVCPRCGNIRSSTSSGGIIDAVTDQLDHIAASIVRC